MAVATANALWYLNLCIHFHYNNRVKRALKGEDPIEFRSPTTFFPLRSHCHWVLSACIPFYDFVIRGPVRVWPERKSLIYVSNWIESFEWNNLPFEYRQPSRVLIISNPDENHRRNLYNGDVLVTAIYACSNFACNPNFIYPDWENNTDRKRRQLYCVLAKSFYRNENIFNF